MSNGKQKLSTDWCWERGSLYGKEDGYSVLILDADFSDENELAEDYERLIAAAPDLLKALEELVSAVDREAMIEGVSGIACDKIPVAKAAISKAKGE